MTLLSLAFLLLSSLSPLSSPPPRLTAPTSQASPPPRPPTSQAAKTGGSRPLPSRDSAAHSRSFRPFQRQKAWPLRPAYKAELVTIGQGHWLFTYFGHNALRFVDYKRGRDINYNFGTFSGARPLQLLRDYLRFEMDYWLAFEYPGWAIRRYEGEDRTYSYRTILLKPEEAERLEAWLREHARPENRVYRYHHYLSNCSTKIRDALEAAIGPTFRSFSQESKGWTYRRHVMDKMRSNPLVMVAMDFGMGPFADKPLTRWEDMFLPQYLEAYLADPRWKGLRGAPLVSEATTLYTRQTPPPWGWQPLPLVYGFFFAWLLWGLRSLRKGRIFGWLRWSLFGLALSGSALFLMMAFTKMPEPPENANILFYHPLHWLAFLFLSKRRLASISNRAGLRMYLAWSFLLAALYLLSKALGIVPPQTNLHFVLGAMAIFGFGTFALTTEPPPMDTAKLGGKG